MRNRGLIIGAAVAAMIAGGVGAFVLTRDAKPKKTPAPVATPEPERHYVIQVDQALVTLGSANGAASGVLRVRTGDTGQVEAVSLSLDPIDTSKGSSGPISVALAQGDTQVSSTGNSLTATFPVEFYYPLLYTVSGGEKVSDDVIEPKKRHMGSATFQGNITNRAWDGQLTFKPDQVEGTDFNLPEGKVAVQGPAVFATDAQLADATARFGVYCIDVQAQKNAFAAGEVEAAVRDAREIWRRNGAAILTKDEIGKLNTTVTGLSTGSSETVDPAKIPTAKCYTVNFVASAKGKGMSADIARRTLKIGKDGATRCKDSTLGRLTAHTFGLVAMRMSADDTTGPEDSLMRDCAPGTSIADEFRSRLWSFGAQVDKDITIPGVGARQNAVFGELEKLLDTLATAVPAVGSPTPSASASVTPRSSRTPRPNPTRTPTRTATSP